MPLLLIKLLVLGGQALQQLFLRCARCKREHIYRYLVVVGGTGTSDDLNSRVFALPLVDNIKTQLYNPIAPVTSTNIKPSIHGTLANVKSSPVTIFGAGSPASFQARVFNEPATTPDQLYSMNSPAAAVGGQAQLPGPITDITVRGDAIFVSTQEGGQGMQPGIFYSQALFDTEGRISGWTLGNERPLVALLCKDLRLMPSRAHFGICLLPMEQYRM